MRFHCLGVGSIGSLLAFHLRQTNPAPKHTVCLLVKRNAFRRDLRHREGGIEKGKASICVESGGVRRRIGGFDVEVHDPVTDGIHALSRIRTLHRPEPPGSAGRDIRPMDPDRTSSTETPAPIQHSHPPPYHTSTIQSLLVTTKAGSTKGALKALKPRLGPSSTIVLLQNGMGQYEQLASEVFPQPSMRPHFIIGTTTHGVWSKGVHDVVHAGPGSIHFAVVPDPLNRRGFEPSYPFEIAATGKAPPLDTSVISGASRYTDDPEFWSLAETLRALLRCTELDPKWVPYDELKSMQGKKLVVNACIGPLTALLECRNGALYGDPSARRLVRQVCSEAFQVFAAEAESQKGKNAESPKSFVSLFSLKSLESEVLRVMRTTSTNFSSMLVDVKRGRQTEIEFINGYLSRLGRAHGVPTPTIDALMEMIRMKGVIPPTPSLDSKL
ncbi:ketopantoate reductase PanE/ApbA C terminal-domain-containing protein [Cantharellus anzutake]|uniref:ketopantoate reductase PanE/ApbA C terminal-domain-containing protein n=1 Tax=Cantharellus anzutake TaxID=1750568 RepID=UPI001906BEA8|nr:ketopantoate reductase PanE/ApbA C terminal-domain-containing protein [Cantharellus anzutake]KAF8337986.1 ketopantoate reductase PanE/ApbA C terminal-domain-containing protein [Cantharellus anzutake]